VYAAAPARGGEGRREGYTERHTEIHDGTLQEVGENVGKRGGAERDRKWGEEERRLDEDPSAKLRQKEACHTYGAPRYSPSEAPDLVL